MGCCQPCQRTLTEICVHERALHVEISKQSGSKVLIALVLWFAHTKSPNTFIDFLALAAWWKLYGNQLLDHCFSLTAMNELAAFSASTCYDYFF